MNQFTFKEYQDKTTETASVYKQAIDKLVDEIGPGKQVIAKMLRISYVGLGLGEVGEIQGKIKKIIRDSGGVISGHTAMAISKELGDLLWYVASTCVEFNLDMGEVAQENIDKLTSRKERGVLGGSGDER